MKPYSNHFTQANLKLTVLLVGIPFLMLILGIGLIVQDSPSTAFNSYQKALSTSDWEAVLALSDDNTKASLDSLKQWAVQDAEDLYYLGAFEQFLVTETQYGSRNRDVTELDRTEIFGILMKALEVRHEMVKAKMINQYYFGEVAVGQLFNTKTRSNTGKKIRFMHESGWKVDAIGLMEAFYDASAYRLNTGSLIEHHTANSNQGYLSRHPQALNPESPERHTL